MAKSAIVAVVAVILSLAAALPAPAQTAKDVSQKAGETVDAIRGYAVESKDDAVVHAKKLAADLDAKVKELEGAASKQAGEARAKSERMIKDLKAKRATAGRKIDDLGKASKAGWDDAKEGFADAYRDLAMAYDRAAAEIKK